MLEAFIFVARRSKSALYSAVYNEYFSNYCLPDTSNMEYDPGVRFSVFPSIFMLIFVHKSFEVHYKSEYKTSRKL